VTLTTDDPLILHLTNDPLLEEYAVASEAWDLTTTDLCEIARNSVYQCGFEENLKKHWLGENYGKKDENNIDKTNVPNARYFFRHDLLSEEVEFLENLSHEDYLLK